MSPAKWVITLVIICVCAVSLIAIRRFGEAQASEGFAIGFGILPAVIWGAAVLLK